MGSYRIKLTVNLISRTRKRSKMVEQHDNVINAAASKKRMHMPHELYGKFSAKSDFIHYFSYQVSLRSIA